MKKSGNGLLLLPDSTGSSFSGELGSVVTKDMNIRGIIENVKILVDPKTKREDIVNVIDCICAFATNLLTEQEIESKLGLALKPT